MRGGNFVNWTMFWDAATAIGTGAMSVFTYLVICQNKNQRRDDARPLLVLMPFDGIDPPSRSDLLSPRSTNTPSMSEYSFLIHCMLNNVGVGPALNVQLQIRFMGRENYGLSRELAPLAAGASRGDTQNPMTLPCTLSDTFNDIDFKLAVGTGWVIVLEYWDVFGNCFHTLHAKEPQKPWVVYGVGPSPKGP